MIEQNPDSFAKFLEASLKGNVVPIIRTVFADLHTPVGAFLRVAHTAEKAFLFESIEGGERLARYSFLAANPFMTVRAENDKIFCDKLGDVEEIVGISLFDYLREHFCKNKLAIREGLPPLCGGAVGFLAYDAVRWFEPVLETKQPNKQIEQAGQTDAVWMFFRTILAFDRLKQQIEIVSVVFTDEANGDEVILKQLFENAVAETEKIEQLLNNTGVSLQINNPKDAPVHEFKSNWLKQDFIESVEKIQQKILDGDCYQVVLSQRFSKKISVNPINIYRALRTTNPSPYMFFMKFGKETLIGASPEMLVRCRDKNLDYRPIAGTRPRGKNLSEDAMLAEEMRSDEKEVSEHIMLVDLGRNDLGRVAEYGSVNVSELMIVEKYSHVQHLVTSLSATLSKDNDRFDALASCFPAGTVSGSPKVRAMQIINELEPTPRGIYAGTIGYIDYADNLDTCIAIRTIEVKDEIASVQTGAGIVFDSVPENEFVETINKARALVRAIELAENGI